MTVSELNMDGLVGPSHHYAGLSNGNLASEQNAFNIANPQAAALQGLAKMKLLHDMGLKQALLPPHPRPNLPLLRSLGLTGSPVELIKKAEQLNPHLLGACYSASSMWTANAATVSPSSDSLDKKIQFTAANLVSNVHRQQEAAFSSKLLKTIFSNPDYFAHHAPLPPSLSLSDEGAANHSRLCKEHGEHGLQLFVYGKQALPANNTEPRPHRYPARQSLEASECIANLHQLSKNHVMFVQQNPAVIDLGVFHNDVISVANENLLLLHEEAYLHQKDLLRSLQERLNFTLHIVEVASKTISVQLAVKSYLFNSQIVTLPDKTMALIAAAECQQERQVSEFIQELIADSSNPLSQVHFLDLKQSMQNGGGPACLRLRVPMNSVELSAMHQGVILNDELFKKLERWIKRHYRTELSFRDLVDPALIDECLNAFDELSSIIGLQILYEF